MMFKGIFERFTPEPFAAIGTPSMKYLTELPDIPFMESSKSEPTPPDSLTLTPVVLFTMVLRLCAEFIMGLILRALTASAVSLSSCALLFPTTITASRFSACSASCILITESPVSSNSFSTVWYPTREATSVYFPLESFNLKAPSAALSAHSDAFPLIVTATPGIGDPSTDVISPCNVWRACALRCNGKTNVLKMSRSTIFFIFPMILSNCRE